MTSFLQKFKVKSNQEKVPEGVSIQYSSFSQPQAYNAPPISQTQTRDTKQNEPSIPQFQNQDESREPEEYPSQQTQTQQKKGKPNFLQKADTKAQQNIQQQQQPSSLKPVNPNVNEVEKRRGEITLNIGAEGDKKLGSAKFKVTDPLALLDENDLNFPQLDFFKKLVNDTVAPGGVRVKQTKEVLDTFVEDCSRIEPCVVGSLLFNKLFSNEVLIVKNRALFAAEALVKGLSQYLQFFKKQQFLIQKAQSFNNQDSKFITLSNQFLAILTNPSLQLEEESQIKFDFSTGSNLSKFGTQKPEQIGSKQQNQQPPSNQQQNTNIIDLIDNDISESKPKSSALFKNLNKKQSQAVQLLDEDPIYFLPPQQPQLLQYQQQQPLQYEQQQPLQQQQQKPKNQEVDLLDMQVKGNDIDQTQQQQQQSQQSGTFFSKFKKSKTANSSNGNNHNSNNNNHNGNNNNNEMDLLDDNFQQTENIQINNKVISQFNNIPIQSNIQSNQQQQQYQQQQYYQQQQQYQYSQFQNHHQYPPFNQAQYYNSFGQYSQFPPAYNTQFVGNNQPQQDYQTIQMDFTNKNEKKEQGLEQSLYGNNFSIQKESLPAKKQVNEQVFDFISM